MNYFVSLWALYQIIGICFGCFERDYGTGSIVCVCTKNKCDMVGPVKKGTPGIYIMYTSSKAGARFNITRGFAYSSSTTMLKETLLINRDKTFQTIFGFGGAFTDSAGINILALSNETQETLLRSYYSVDGIEYSMGRVPIGGTDFSTRGYTYDDVDDDLQLKFFSLQNEDNLYKIPIIQKAINLSGNNLKLFGTAWTAPAWMKTNHKLTSISFLNISMLDLWAEYHYKFLEAYDANNITFWGLTTGNEPSFGFLYYIVNNKMAWTPLLHAQWIAQNLGPKLRFSKKFSYIKIMIVDDQRVYIPWIPRVLLNNDYNARSYIDGTAVHFYTDQFVSAEVLSVLHYDFPDKFILATEGCTGVSSKEPVLLGSWERAESYLNSILDDLNNWATGWIDWNIALNTEGGPTYIYNYVDSPIIVNKSADEFLKQPMYYAMGHFSKFLPPDSVRISSIYSGESNLKCVTFQRPDGGIVVMIFNPLNEDRTIKIKDKDINIPVNVIKRSINSILYWI